MNTKYCASKGSLTVIGRVYKDRGVQNIELLSADLFDYSLPSKLNAQQHLSEIFHDGNHENDLLLLPEIISNESDEFYFEIVGQIEIRFIQGGSWEYPSEVDCEVDFPKYTFSLLNEKTALELSGSGNDDIPFDDVGTPQFRLNLLLKKLEERFPEAHNNLMSDPPEPKYLAEIDRLIKLTKVQIK
jgi:hypothetical protein